MEGGKGGERERGREGEGGERERGKGLSPPKKICGAATDLNTACLVHAYACSTITLI